MAISSLLPWIVIAVVALLVLRAVVGVVKTSAKMLLWLVIAAAAALGWLWWQANEQTAVYLPATIHSAESEDRIQTLLVSNSFCITSSEIGTA